MLNIFNSKVPMFDGKQYRTNGGEVFSCVGFLDNENGVFVVGVSTDTKGTIIRTHKIKDVEFILAIPSAS